MSCIAAALEADDNVRFLGQHICDLAFSLVSPVSTYDRSNHTLNPPWGYYPICNVPPLACGFSLFRSFVPENGFYDASLGTLLRDMAVKQTCPVLFYSTTSSGISKAIIYYVWHKRALCFFPLLCFFCQKSQKTSSRHGNQS